LKHPTRYATAIKDNHERHELHESPAAVAKNARAAQFVVAISEKCHFYKQFTD
jgi:hypothetical protein